MEFQGTITCERGSSLGTLASVQLELTSMFPGLVFAWSASGVEKLADLRSRDVDLPEIVRCSLLAQPAFLCAVWDKGPLSVSFNVGSADPVMCVWVTISGDEARARQALAFLQARRGWVVTSPEPR